jgi:hypothetical protein
MQDRNEGSKEFEGVVGGEMQLVIEKSGSQIINMKT